MDWTSIAHKLGIKVDGVNLVPFRGAVSTGGVATTAGGTISKGRLVQMSGATVVQASLNSVTAYGVANNDVVSGEAVVPLSGCVKCISGGALKAGEYIKAAADGRVINFIDATQADKALLASVGDEFTSANQPANDGVDIVSTDANDVGTVTIIGTTTATDTVVVEVMTLNGTTRVTSTKTDWGFVLAVKSTDHLGTISIDDATGNAAITTLAAGTNSAGVHTVQLSTGGAAPTIDSDNAGTKTVGMQYTDVNGAIAYMAEALAGTTETAMPSAANDVQEVYLGHVIAADTVTVLTDGTQDTIIERSLGRCIETVTGGGVEVHCNIS